MQVWGLTGGMASGKSTVAGFFRRAGVPVFDADACVHQLQQPHGRALPAIEQVFSGVVHHNQLDRAALRARVMQEPDGLHRLETILHPIVRQERMCFLRHCRARGVPLCVLDVPLLWETGVDALCDCVLVTEAPLAVRLARIRRRAKQGGGMTEAEARHLIARQMSDEERRKRADIILKTGLSRGYLTRRLQALLQTALAADRDEHGERSHDAFHFI